MKRKKLDIDALLRQHLPRVSNEEVEASGERVLNRLREQFQREIEEFTLTPGRWEQLTAREYLVLTAVHLLGDAPAPVVIAHKVEELVGKSVNWGGVFLELDRLEDRGLLMSKVIKDAAGAAQRQYKVRAMGKRSLEHARVEQTVTENLTDLAF